jgi:hypothetical protein
MAIPTQPTESSIITKAYRLYKEKSPTSQEITNAGDAIAMVKSDIMNQGREWSPLRDLAYVTMTENVNHIQAPTDYSKLLHASVLDGTRRDTAQAGAASTITLAASDSGTENDTEAKLIVITGGTGEGQARAIQDYNSSTKVATVDSSWDTNPDATSTYLVVDSQYELEMSSIWNYDEIHRTHLKDRPTTIYHQADDAEGDFYFDYAPDKAYVIQLRYYTDIRKMDTDTGTNVRYARILRIFEQLFVQGVFSWLLQDDSRYQGEVAKYSSLLIRMAGEFLYPDHYNQRAEIAEDAY